MAETVADQENYTYIPLSSFVILLVIILTCASRRKKTDAFNAIEQNTEEDFREDYTVMCFPCLKKKPRINEIAPTTDLTDQFEYIVEKYTIRKVPLLLANTPEDIIERQEEIGLEKVQLNQPQMINEDFLNVQTAQEVYNVQKSPPCLTVAPHTSCPGKRALRERSRPTDILESMSPIPRPLNRNPNYVVIPTKGSLRHKDIMMTKREITNQYLNNFSSVFVDNLKDQIPKDPERYPNLSRPYTSAIRDLPLAENLLKPALYKKSNKRKYHKVAYTFPAEEFEGKEEQEEEEDDEVDEEDEYKEMADEEEIEEEGYEMEEEGDIVNIREEDRYYFSDSESKDQMQVVSSSRPEEGSEYQEDAENDPENFVEKSKSFVLINDNDSTKEAPDIVANPFKTTIQSTPPEADRGRASPSSTTFTESLTKPPFNKDDWSNARTVTYEDIQSLDVGYEFTSSEKLGVKPKMTRIPYLHENDRLKEAYKQIALGDTKISKRGFISQEQLGGVKPKSPRIAVMPKSVFRALDCTTHMNPYLPPTEKFSSKSSITETSFLSKPDLTNSEGVNQQKSRLTNVNSSTTTMTSQTEESKSCEMDYENNVVASVEDTVKEISKMYDLSEPLSQSRAAFSNNDPESEEMMTRLPAPSKSRSFHDLGRTGLRKESTPEAKGKDNLPYTVENSNENPLQKVEGIDNETSCSLSQSKTSSAVTSPRSSEPDDGKRATLRWKIVIKHHRENNHSKKNLNKNVKN